MDRKEDRHAHARGSYNFNFTPFDLPFRELTCIPSSLANSLLFQLSNSHSHTDPTHSPATASRHSSQGACHPWSARVVGRSIAPLHSFVNRFHTHGQVCRPIRMIDVKFLATRGRDWRPSCQQRGTCEKCGLGRGNSVFSSRFATLRHLQMKINMNVSMKRRVREQTQNSNHKHSH